MNTIEEITNFIFVGKSIDELSHYDLLIINADWAEEQLAKDLKRMLDRNIIDRNTLAVYKNTSEGMKAFLRFVDEVNKED